jgi:hypothetical protein
MTKKSPAPVDASTKNEGRIAAALRENLRKRKAQQQARAVELQGGMDKNGKD